MLATLKVLAEGMFFTPRALFKDVSGIIDLVIFIVSLVWLCWMPKHISPNSAAQAFILLRCFRPLRIFNLVSAGPLLMLANYPCNPSSEQYLQGILIKN